MVPFHETDWAEIGGWSTEWEGRSIARWKKRKARGYLGLVGYSLNLKTGYILNSSQSLNCFKTIITNHRAEAHPPLQTLFQPTPHPSALLSHIQYNPHTTAVCILLSYSTYERSNSATWCPATKPIPCKTSNKRTTDRCPSRAMPRGK